MDTKELIKRYWFVGVVAIALLAFVGVYTADQIKNRPVTVDTKQVDGKYVAYSVDDTDVYADEFYDSLYELNGLSQAMIAYQRAVFAQGYETTEEMNQNASNSAASILSRYSQEYVEQSLISMGYTGGIDELIDYYVDSQKQELMVKEYVLAHQDDYLTPQVGTNGRLIYHILVKTDVEPIRDENDEIIGYEALPTDEQKEKLAQIQEALQDENNTFEYTAYLYSEDSSSSYGGYIGLINEENMNNYDEVFAKTAMALKEDEVSEPIVSQFGYHIIWNAAQTPEKLLDDYYFIGDLESAYPNMTVKATVDKGEELGFEIVSETLAQQIAEQLESEEN